MRPLGRLCPGRRAGLCADGAPGAELLLAALRGVPGAAARPPQGDSRFGGDKLKTWGLGKGGGEAQISNKALFRPYLGLFGLFGLPPPPLPPPP